MVSNAAQPTRKRPRNFRSDVGNQRIHIAYSFLPIRSIIRAHKHHAG